MSNAIIQLFPTPEPPPTVPALLRRRLPVVIPAYYSQRDIDRRLAGDWTPVHVATVTRLAIYDIQEMTIAKLAKGKAAA